MKSKITFLIVTFVIFSLSQASAQLAILSGPSQGSYYEFVGDIEKVLSTDSTKLVINTESDGSAYNFDQLANPRTPYKVALIQSDFLYTMHGMDMLNNTEKTKNIKVLLPLADEEIHLVTKKDSELNKLQDLSKKMVAIGTQNQGTYYTSNIIKDRSKVFWTSRNLAFEDALSELRQDNIVAFFIVGSAPMEKLNINPQAFSVGLKLMPLRDFDNWAQHYENDTIYAGDYKWLEDDVPTFKIKTLLVVNEAKLSDEDRKNIDLMVEGINAKMDTLRSTGHFKWKDVNLTNWDSSNWPVYK